VGTKLGGIEEEEGMNEPRAPRGFIYWERGLVAAGPRETVGRPPHPWPPPAPRGNPRAPGLLAEPILPFPISLFIS
jgi:hypothetical protein